MSAHLLASAGMDHTVSIWNVWSRGQKRARVFGCHRAAVKDVKWSPSGLSVLSCGYDCASRLVDVEKGMEIKVFKEEQVVEVVKFSPNNYDLFISGGSKGHLKLWDVRTGAVVHEYVRNLGPILDVEFTVDGMQLITSTDVSKSNISENSIIVWDVSREVPLSNQVIYFNGHCCGSNLMCILMNSTAFLLVWNIEHLKLMFCCIYPFYLIKWSLFTIAEIFNVTLMP